MIFLLPFSPHHIFFLGRKFLGRTLNLGHRRGALLFSHGNSDIWTNVRNGKREASSQPLTPGNSENKFLSHLCLLQSLPRHVLFSLPVIDTEPGCSRAALSLPHCRHISWVPIVWHQLGRWEGCRLPPLGAVSWAASLLGWGNRGAWTHVLALGIFCSASCCPACLLEGQDPPAALGRKPSPS